MRKEIMPIESRRIAKGIYHHKWQGHVSADEVLETAKLEQQWLAEDGAAGVVGILDATEMRTFPLNIPKLIKAFSKDDLATLIYKAPQISKQVGEIVASLSGEVMEFIDDWDTIVARAHKIQADAEQKRSSA